MSKSTTISNNELLSKAWVYYEQGSLAQKLQQATLPISTDLRSNEILIEIKAVALNPVDIQLGNIPHWIVNWLLYVVTNNAKIPAADFSGIVYKTGTNVTKYKVGDEVFGLNLSITGNGCLSQYIKLSENLSSLSHKPSNVSHLEAAAMPLAFYTAYTALHDWAGFDLNASSKNKKVLILGASGGVGHIACQIARSMNAYIVGTCSRSNIEFVKEMGADEVIDYTQNDIVETSKQYGPYDLILDCVGGTQFIPYLNADFLQTNQSIYLTIVGDKTSRNILGGMTTYLFTPAMMLRSLKSMLSLGPRYYCINLSMKEENTNQMLRMLSKNMIRPIIDSVFDFSTSVREAYERLDTGRVRGKVLIDFDK